MKCPATGKLRHADREAAVAAKARLSYGIKMQPYSCPACDGWHLGGHHRRHERDELAQFGRRQDTP